MKNVDSGMSSEKILLVDDEKPFIEIIARRLRQRGFTVVCDLNDLISKAKRAVARKRERVRIKPYISERERDRLISNILEK